METVSTVMPRASPYSAISLGAKDAVSFSRIDQGAEQLDIGVLHL